MEDINNDDQTQRLTSQEPPFYLFDCPHPWLLITHEEDAEHQAFYNVSKDSHHTKVVPELRNKHVCDGGGSNGWLYVEDCDSKECNLLNIATMEKVSLPPLVGENSTVRRGSCFITSEPSNLNCRVIVYDSCVCNDISCKVGDEAFVLRKMKRGGSGCLSSYTMLEGKMYALLMGQQELVVCDTIEESYRFKKVGIKQDEKLLGGGPGFVVECGGEILLIVKRLYGSGIREMLPFRVYRADFSKKEWVRVKNIGKHAIFLQMQHRGYSCSTEGLEGVKENCIYFTLWDDRHIHVFDLEDESFSLILPCPHIYSYGSKLTWVIAPAKPDDTKDLTSGFSNLDV